MDPITVELQEYVKDEHNNLLSTSSEYSEEDDLVSKHAKVAEEAIEGWEKAEAEVMFLKQELNEALRQRIAAEERIYDLDAALKECMEHLHFNLEKQEHICKDVVMHTCRERERTGMLLEEQLRETSNQLAKLELENSHLSKALRIKENLIEDLSKCKFEAEANFNKLISGVDLQENGDLTSASASEKQHSDSMLNIIKLENECQTLRLLVQKLLPVAATFEEIKSEMQGKEPDGFSSQMIGLMVKSFTSHDTLSERINTLIEKLCSVEEENKTLKETITKKNNEIHCLRTINTHTTSNLWRMPKAESPTELARCTSPGLSATSLSERSLDDEISCSESRTSALISELEHFTNMHPMGTPSSKTVAVSSMSLIDKSYESSNPASHESKACRQSLGTNTYASSATSCRELVPEISIMCTHPYMPQMESSSQSSAANVSPGNGLNSDVSGPLCRIIELIEGFAQPSLMNCSSSTLWDDIGGSLGHGNSDSSSAYTVRVFQWKSSELHYVLQRFVHTCNDLVDGKVALENFPSELNVALEWISNHCFSVLDVSRMRERVKSYFDWDEPESECERERLDEERPEVFHRQVCLSSTTFDGQNGYPWVEDTQLKLKEENMILKQKVSNMESVQKDLEEKLQLATEKIEELLIQLRESEESTVGISQRNLEPKGTIESQPENSKVVSDDLDTQLMVARHELNVACQNSLSLELELENKTNRFQELETTCIDLQLQLDSAVKREAQKHDTRQADGNLQTGWEITAVSEKLAECQTTILNLRKQLKALASPKEIALLDKVVSFTPATSIKSKSAARRCSLLEKMLCEDNANFEEFISPKKKETTCAKVDSLKSFEHPTNIPGIAPSVVKSPVKVIPSNKPKHKAATGQAIAILPYKRCTSSSLIRNIMMRRKGSAGKK